MFNDAFKRYFVCFRSDKFGFKKLDILLLKIIEVGLHNWIEILNPHQYANFKLCG